MTNRIAAVFEHGVFRPVQPISLEDGARVELVYRREQPLKPPGPMVQAIEEIARMPLEGPDDGFSGAEHDKILYGEEGAR
jgi:predicted DNA-binding antitoxin AbrB/MazE fold protein